MGCIDEQTNNYNSEANLDDGSYAYDVMGCIDEQANNYNSEANLDDGSCTYDVMGCTDEQTNNYNSEANVDDGSCTYDVMGCTDEQTTITIRTNDDGLVYMMVIIAVVLTQIIWSIIHKDISLSVQTTLARHLLKMQDYHQVVLISL